jgi:NAD(P)-dependent dehydrogenase (short-subunit alcohol dehydrogenase family)
VKVLLTGSAGFIGSHIASQLAASGHDVVGVDAMIAQAHVPGTVPPRGAHHLDVRDDEGMARLLVGVDVVCHQAAMVGNGIDAQDLPQFAAHNDLGTAVLLAAMARAGVERLVLASSMVVYGDGAFRCQEHGPVDAAPRRHADLEQGMFDPRCPRCDRALDWDGGGRGVAVPSPDQLCRVQGRAGALRRRLVHPAARQVHRAALPQRLRAAHAGGHPVRGRGGGVPVGARAW